MRYTTFKQFILLLAMMLPAAWCGANGNCTTEGYDPIPVKEATVQGYPKGSTIQASINGHTLMIAFSENLGQVQVGVTTAAGATVQCVGIQTAFSLG